MASVSSALPQARQSAVFHTVVPDIVISKNDIYIFAIFVFDK